MTPNLPMRPYFLKWLLLMASHAILLFSQNGPGSAVSITLGPANVSLTATQTQQFTATISGSTNTGATWSVTPQVGTISSGGLYTAPATVNSVQNLKVIATSLADPTKAATAVVTLMPGGVSITLGPASASLTASQTQQFTATITGSSNTGATWSISPQMGSISSGGLYTAPVTIPSAQNVTVTATSLADPTKIATAVVALTPSAVSINLGPASASLTASQTQQFTATVSGSSNTGATWSISPQMGTISSGGLYTAPATITSAQNVTVTASSLADPTKTATAVVALKPVVSITLGPANASLTASQTQQFTATVSGSSNTGATWSISPQTGSISSGGLYTAPATITSAQNVTITASSLVDPTKTATAVVALTPGAVSINLGPASASLTTSQTQQFTATVSGSSNTGATWSISPQMGTISSGGLYTAPATITSAQNVTVTAGSLADPTKTATAVVALTPGVSITLGPANASLAASQTQQFSATVTGSSNAGVSWSISPQAGTISSGGLYTAPATISSGQNVTVTASSLADPAKTATAVVALTSAVVVYVGPANTNLSVSQTQQFTAKVTGSSNTGVSWSISPQVGAISSGGLYTAPATISAAQNVTVTATSLADPAKTATALVALRSIGSASVVSITLAPANVSLSASQTQQFTATVTGSGNTGVSWSISPQLGTISTTGFYTSPANTSSSVVTVTAMSLADPTSTATATVTLTPVVSITVGPVSASLTASQTQQFTATVAGTSNTGVSWSINPALGTISSGGLYTAPSAITSAQNVMLTATSLADATKTAVAVISLALSPPPLTISITAPANGSTVSGNVVISATAGPSGGVAGVQFYADSLPVGALVTAPPYTVNWNSASVSDGAHTLSAMGQDLGGNKSTATVTVSVSNTPTVSAVSMPVEVIGPDLFTKTAQVNVDSVPAGALRLWLQIHGLRYQTQASVQVNNSGWIPINDTTATLLGQAGAYGGIGGGFHTLKMTLNLPAGAVTTGTNTVSFRFNGTDGRVSGFRVLAFNFLGLDGTGLLPAQTFVNENPNTWQAPSTLASDIAVGKTLWYGANLTVPKSTGPTPIRAKCSSCHAQDGRDLKYFNYSNNSIRARSRFHGLSPEQGDQIASYIRSLNVPNPGRPWNPPYQPGPGLDSQPVEMWSAGAGLDAVLNSDQDLLNELFPYGIQAATFSATGRLNVRETRIHLQLPDWNSWLPGIHPIDAWGDEFLNSKYYQDYLDLRSQLRYADPVAYANVSSLINTTTGNYAEFMTPKVVNLGPTPDPNFWTPDYINKIYSSGVFGVVKTWELNQEFGLEGMARTVFKHPLADSRAWQSNLLFLASPNMLHIPRGFPGLDNGKVSTFVYQAFIWYHTQLILNNSNGYQQEGTAPIDWAYVYGFIHELGLNANPGQAGLMTLWKIKALQISNNGNGPDLTSGPVWHPVINDPSTAVLQNPGGQAVFAGIAPATRQALYEGYVRAFLDVVEKFTPAQFYAGGFADPGIAPVRGQPFGAFGDRVWYAIPLFRYFGVNQSLINEFADWAKTVWPLVNWDLTKTDTCTVRDTGIVVCSTYY